MHEEDPAIPQSHRPPANLDEAGAGPVPQAVPRPGESEGEAAARVAREADGDQNPWGEPEDRPDHEGNEVYEQQDETRPPREGA
jgi:hypothetical protein